MGIEARDEVKWLQHYIDELNGKVDLTVALIHEGVPARQSSRGGTDVRRALDKDIQTAGQVKSLGRFNYRPCSRWHTGAH